jgi:hypothetical protein
MSLPELIDQLMMASAEDNYDVYEIINLIYAHKPINTKIKEIDYYTWNIMEFHVNHEAKYAAGQIRLYFGLCPFDQNTARHN